jgi:DNA-binding NarL/FixJ family response regulator
LHFSGLPDQIVLLGMHRRRRDFDDADMDALSLLHEPLASALAFRRALDTAVARLTRRLAADSVRAGVRLTRREGDVLALVARGWTNQRIARRLSITERTVRKHLECAREKIGACNRAEAAAWWAREVWPTQVAPPTGTA